jgi:hypothetical protein
MTTMLTLLINNRFETKKGFVNGCDIAIGKSPIRHFGYHSMYQPHLFFHTFDFVLYATAVTS